MNTEQLQSPDVPEAGLRYYDGPEIVGKVLTSLREAGLDPEALDVDDLAPLDEFHALGRAATVSLAELAGLRGGERVLDVGAGIGGPARLLASRYDVHVTAVDATPRFCTTAERLTQGTGLTERVRIVCADARALPFPSAHFDLVWTQAVAQNIADKSGFIAELARVVRPGGRLAMFEVLAGPGGAIEFPVPWGDGPEQSWLPTPEELHELLDRGPLSVRTWNQGQDALNAIGRAAQRIGSRPVEHGLGLDLLMPDHDARMAGLARNVAERRIELVQAIVERRCQAQYLSTSVA